MPSQDYNGIKLLIKEGPVDEIAWRELLEARRALIKPYLDNFFLQRVAHLRILSTAENQPDHTLETDSPTVQGDCDCLDIRIQGVFFEGLVQADPEKHTKIIPGLSRSGEWLIVVVDYDQSDTTPYQSARTVTVFQQTIAEIVTWGFPVRDIWRELKSAIRAWKERREQQYKECMELCRIIDMEDRILLNRPGA